MPYLSKRARQGLLDYRYSGGDTSYIYKYILSPMADAFVTVTPEWLAPNTITLTSFSTSVVSFFLSYHFAPDLDTGAQAWLPATIASLLLVYQLLDNMDGKQARKTGNGSPLGLLFDHGCDAANTCIAGIAFASCLGIGRSALDVLLLLSVPLLPFWFATWEEYHVGTLVLPPVNGPTEGLLLSAGSMYWTALCGSTAWWQASSFGLPFPNYHLLTACGLGGAALTSACQVVNVLRHVREEGQSVGAALSHLAPFAAFAALAYGWVFVAPDFLAAHIHAFVLLLGFVFTEMAASLMLAHVCDVKWEPRARWLVGVLALNVANAAPCGWGGVVPAEFLLHASVALAGATAAHFAYGVIDEITDVLGIRAFKVKSA